MHASSRYNNIDGDLRTFIDDKSQNDIRYPTSSFLVVEMKIFRRKFNRGEEEMIKIIFVTTTRESVCFPFPSVHRRWNNKTSVRFVWFIDSYRWPAPEKTSTACIGVI